MHLVLTPAGGGQPVTLGFPSSTSQGAINLAQMLTSFLPTDTLLVVRDGVLCGVAGAIVIAVAQQGQSPSPFDMSASGNSNSFFIMLGAA